MNTEEQQSLATDADDTALGEPKSWGHNPLSAEELSIFRHITNRYGVYGSSDDELLEQWSESKRLLMQILGGHTLEASITCGDYDLANDLLSGEFYDTVYRRLESWWRNRPCEGGGCGGRIYNWPSPQEVVDNRLLPTGEKLSKRVSKELSSEAREEFLSAHSSLIAKCRASGYIRLSVNPLELLAISDSATFSSCHSVESGETYKVGNFSYLIDPHTIVAYYYSDQRHSDLHGTDWPRKKWRQLIYVDTERRSAIVSRHYPNERDTIGKAARTLLFRKIASFYELPPDRLISKQQDSAGLTNHGRGYIDEDTFRTVYLKDGGDRPQITIPSATVEIPQYICAHCDGPVQEYDVRTDYDGHYVCETCWEDTSFRCVCCGGIYDIVCAYSSPIGLDYCSVCYHDNFFNCDLCGEDFDRGDRHTIGNDTYCEACYNNINEEREDEENAEEEL